MIEKTLKKPHELLIYEALLSRIPFSKKEESYFHNLKLGYEGEEKFEQLLKEKIDDQFIVISDLWLEVHTTTFQIDSILLTGDTLCFFDVKNYPGNYIHAEKRWYKLPQKEINNPLLQLKRNETLMRQILLELNVDLAVDSYDVFINPEFTLYQAPVNKQLIFPTQIPKFIKELVAKPPITSLQHSLAKQLIARDLGKYPHPRIPTYEYHQLTKGFRCGKCCRLTVYIEGRNCVCSKCQQVEPVHGALLQNIEELRLLFPDKKLTTNLVYDWCGGGYSKKSIKRFLEKNFRSVGTHKWVYYL
ncbi:NERD domain-containing protein [Gracilibacillus salitolerans]|uniref:NERD domain-containing protein n=1 Tax=Gracilibacillus salitolerans TaxID=2663022 RepID=A0A5Q2TEA5_9BACI|nr:nuclease-related domain-containing protein [Gracilibacillus salitolerans]QGH33084.1 NERD domain-containing protein [Gracilibacillus salitolerans]